MNRAQALGASIVALAFGCNVLTPEVPVAGSTSSASTAAGSQATTGSPSSSSTTTTSPGTSSAAAAVSARAAALQAIANAYAGSGDLNSALQALGQMSATPQELLAALRGPRAPTAPVVGGHQSVTIQDDYNETTDLQIEAPPTAQIQAQAQKGLGLVLMLHGLGGNAGQTVGLGTELAATNQVVAVGPSAKNLPPGFAPEDGCPASIASQFPMWWMYADPNAFPMQAIKTACSMYPIDPERVVLVGASMGGYGAWNVGMRHADRFAGVAELCGGITRLGQVGMQDPTSNALLVNGLMWPFWGAHGDQDTVVPLGPDQQAAQTLQQMGGNVTFHVVAGAGHDLAASALSGSSPLAAELLSFLTTKVRQPSPASVNCLSANPANDGAYWCRIKTSGGGNAQIQGSIDTSTNTISISGSNVSLARIYLDERILDATRQVTITANGAVKWQGMITPDFTSILESWASRLDEGLVYPAFAEVPPQ
jgi:predicted esterase